MAKRGIRVKVDYNSMRVLYGLLIKKYGDGEELETFEICSEEGIDLAGSTIDRIAFEHGGQDIMFYFNENTGDCDMLEEFKLKDLASFYDELKPILESGEYDYYDPWGNVGEGNSARHDLE